MRAASAEYKWNLNYGEIAKVFRAVARHEADAVGMERVERVFDLAQRLVHVRHRQHRKNAEAAAVIGDGEWIERTGSLALRLAGHKLPVKTKFVLREDGQ